MRQMFDFVSNVGQQVAKTLNDQIKTGGESNFEMKDLARKFTVDVSLVKFSVNLILVKQIISNDLR